MAESIRIVTWNANVLRQHETELEIFLEEQKIDICLISETYFTKESNFKIRCFITYHTLHPSNNARGGASVIIRDNIKHHEETKFSTESIQASAVQIRYKRYQFITAAIYSPPKYNIKQDKYSKFFQTLGNSFINRRGF